MNLVPDPAATQITFTRPVRYRTPEGEVLERLVTYAVDLNRLAAALGRRAALARHGQAELGGGVVKARAAGEPYTPKPAPLPAALTAEAP